jgi:outer membrane protein insertion porin family
MIIALILTILMTQSAPDISPSDSEIVSGIEVQCEGDYPAEEVYKAISPLLQAPLMRYKLRKTVEEIYAIGLFSQVEVEKLPFNGGVKLVFILKLKEVIRRVRFSGNRHISEPRLYAVIKSREGTEYAETLVRQDVEEIKATYRRTGFYETKVTTRIGKLSAQEVELTFQIKEGDRARIGQVSFVGNKAFDSKTLLKGSGLKDGSPYSEGLLREALKKLEEFYVEKGFLTARVRKLREAYFPMIDRINLQIEVKEGPMVEVSFEGNRHIDDDRLRSAILLFRLRELSEFVLRRSVLDIETAYRRAGFYNAKASYRIEGDLREKVVVRFKVEEGRRFKIKRIEFEGNRAFTDKELKRRISTREAGWSIPFVGNKRKGIYDEELFKIDLRALEIFYRRNGYLDVRIDEPEVKVEGDELIIKVKIDEGPRRWVRRIRIEGCTIFTEAELIKGLSTKVDEPINEETLIADKTYIRSRYAERGYIYAQVEPRFDSLSGTVTFHVKEGKPVRVGRITFSGNERTDESALRREMALKEREVFNATKLAESRVNLFRLGLFRSIRFDLEGVERESDVVNISVHLVERNSGSVNLSGGYSPAEGVRATFELSHRNLFGRARRFSTKLRVGTLGNRYEIFYLEPWFLGTRTRGTARVFREDLEERENALATGVILGLTRKVKRANDVSLQYRYQILSGPDFQTSISSVGAVFQRDTRDSFLDPCDGWLNELSAEYAGGLLRGQNSFFKLTGALRNYRCLLPSESGGGYRLAYAWAIRAGYAKGLRATRQIIIFERFKIGGANTVRGYREGVLGPSGEGRGDIFFVGNLELRSWIYRFIGLSLFLDVGNIWGNLSDIRFDGLNTLEPAVGMGLRFNTPIGPLRLDYGYPLDGSKDIGMAGEIWFSFGNAF